MTASSIRAMASETLDLVTHDNARPASPALFLVGNVTMTYGEPAKSVSEYETALRRDGKALVLCAGDRDLPVAGTAIFRRKGTNPTGEIYTDLDDLERMVERPGHPTAVVCGTDDVVHLVGAGDADVHEQQRRQLVESLGVPSRHVVFRPVDQLPRTPGGKVDYVTLATVVDTHGRAG